MWKTLSALRSLSPPDDLGSVGQQDDKDGIFCTDPYDATKGWVLSRPGRNERRHIAPAWTDRWAFAAPPPTHGDPRNTSRNTSSAYLMGNARRQRLHISTAYARRGL
nr:hypothetical protein CFP56_11582 [Quercus suber]